MALMCKLGLNGSKHYFTAVIGSCFAGLEVGVNGLEKMIYDCFRCRFSLGGFSES